MVKVKRGNSLTRSKVMSESCKLMLGLSLKFEARDRENVRECAREDVRDRESERERKKNF